MSPQDLDRLEAGFGAGEYVPANHPLAKRSGVLALIQRVRAAEAEVERLREENARLRDVLQTTGGVSARSGLAGEPQ